MSRKQFISIHAAGLLLAVTPIAAQERTPSTFEREGGGWVQVAADGTRFEVHPEVITIKFADGAGRAVQAAVLDELGGEEIRRARTGFVDVRIRPDQDVLDAVAAFAADPRVSIAEPNSFGTYTLVPDDPTYPSQWHLPQVNANEAWDITTGGPGAVIAVLDSGTEFTHSDLGTGADAYQNVWLNDGEDAWSDPNDPDTGNGVDDDSNGFIDDWKGWNFGDGDNDPSGLFGHGTNVAGVAAAKTHNGVGVAGVAGGWNGPGARILIAGVGNFQPDGSVLDDAILYAAESGAQIIQLSLTVAQTSAIDAAVDMAFDTYGALLICSSGNDGIGSVGYPSSHPKIMAIGSTDMSDFKSTFSQFGPDLEVSAPGENIWTTNVGNGYTSTGGTSFSSPLTSGIVALMLSVNPDLTNTELRQILHDTADKVGGYDYNWNAATPGHSRELGYGRVNSYAAVMAANPGIFADGFESGDTSSWSASSP